ncbi:MAG: 3-oxoacid CoA-transferase subunit B [Desulforudis sp.]|jgi:acetate CoA/acetoacetate CoA-transferase beta subunit|nr:MAG: 3-oxoacid CoA-transferase subunit B [Desulforudis sp.]
MGLGREKRPLIARRAAHELQNGMIVNLGIGIPTMVADFVPEGIHVVFQAENGILGYGTSPREGEEDPFVCNAGGLPVTLMDEASYFDSTVAFGMIRRGFLDLTVLGALQVSEKGDLANWIVPGKRVPGMGGAIDLAQKAKRVVVVTEHVSRDGLPKILRECTYPLTVRESVDLIITDMAVIEVTPSGLVLKEVAREYEVADVVRATEAPLFIPEDVGQF